MLARNTAFAFSLLYTLALTQTIQSCEISTCVFNKEYNGKKKVIKIKAPKKESWISPDKLDGIDKTIFGETAIPYNYKNIINASQKQLFYVKNATYQKLIVIAQEQLHNKKQAIKTKYENRKESIDPSSDVECMRLSEAINRLEEHEKMLKKHDRFEHICPGIILTTQTKRCIALWTSLNQKQN